MMRDEVIIAECGCPTPRWDTCSGCGCCKGCCDGYGCDDCGEKCQDRFDGPGGMSLCDSCLQGRWNEENVTNGNGEADDQGRR